MADTYTQLYVHVVFATCGRHRLIPDEAIARLHQYMTATIRRKQHKPVAAGGLSDHVHFLIGLNPAEALSDLIRDVKANSSAFVRRERLVPGHFAWQRGYGAFTHSRKELTRVVRYVLNQQEHHARTTFREEYEAMLDAFDVTYERRYLFDE